MRIAWRTVGSIISRVWASPPLGPSKGLHEKGCDRHRTHTIGDWGDEGSPLRGRIEIDIASVVGLSRIDHHRTRLDPLALDDSRHPDRRHDDIGSLDVLAQVRGTRMAVRHGRVAPEQRRAHSNTRNDYRRRERGA
jgi:hypothetical protein